MGLNTLTKMRHVESLQLKTASSIWQRAVKRTTRLVGLLERVVPLIVGSSSLSWVKAVASFGKFVTVLISKQGQKGTALYLKTANISLLRSISGCKLDGSRLAGSAVSLSRAGLPRVIPAGYRKRIRDGDTAVIRLWLGLFTLYRVLDFRGKIKLNTITDPGVEISNEYIGDWCEFINQSFNPSIGKFGVKRLTNRLMYHRERTGTDEPANWSSEKAGRTFYVLPELADSFTRFVIGKSGPNSRSTKKESVEVPTIDGGSKTKTKSWQTTSTANVLNDCYSWISRETIFGDGILSELRCLARLSEVSHALTGAPWEIARKYQEYVHSVRTSGASWPSTQARLERLAPGSHAEEMENSQARLGKIGVREEPGKMRLFAMVDCWTQWILYPLHKYLFKQLARIPNDGTFDQVKPVKDLVERCRLKGIRQIYSFDLSAATDRIPVVLQEKLLATYTTPTYAASWRAVLCDRWYWLPASYTKTYGDSVRAVKYAVGQPMGALSSWAMLALTHHAIVQYAASKAGHRGWFSEYAVLGDDVVIASREVADRYRQIMKEIGVEIGFNKSILSTNLSLEFAKRFFYKGEEVTPFPLVGVAVGLLGASYVPEVIQSCEKLVNRRISLFLIAKYLGVGFKAASGASNKLYTKLPRKLRSALLLLSRPGAVRGLVDHSEWLRSESFGTAREVTKEVRQKVAKELLLYVRDELVPKVRERFDDLTKSFKPDDWPLQKFHDQWKSELNVWWEDYIVTWLRQDNLLLTMEAESLAREAVLDMEYGDTRLAEVLLQCEEIIAATSLIPFEVNSLKERNPLKDGKPQLAKRSQHVSLWKKYNGQITKGCTSRKPCSRK